MKTKKSIKRAKSKKSKSKKFTTKTKSMSDKSMRLTIDYSETLKELNSTQFSKFSIAYGIADQLVNIYNSLLFRQMNVDKANRAVLSKAMQIIENELDKQLVVLNKYTSKSLDQVRK
jgi:hypothetical protein